MPKNAPKKVPKKLYEVQVWDYHMTRKVRSFWTQISVRKDGDESKMRRAAWMNAREQAYKAGTGEYFEMESFQIKVVNATQRAIDERNKLIVKENPNYGTCPDCGESTVEQGDYCDHCGWSRYASWRKGIVIAGANNSKRSPDMKKEGRNPFGVNTVLAKDESEKESTEPKKGTVKDSLASMTPLEKIITLLSKAKEAAEETMFEDLSATIGQCMDTARTQQEEILNNTLNKIRSERTPNATNVPTAGQISGAEKIPDGAGQQTEAPQVVVAPQNATRL